MKTQGFTLIEVVITTAVLVIVLLTAGLVLTNALRTSSQTQTISVLENAANQTMAEIKKDILSSSGKDMRCPAEGEYSNFLLLIDAESYGSYSLTCLPTGYSTTIRSQIASDSGTYLLPLTPSNVSIPDCSEFVSCDYDSGGTPTAVNIKFTLQIGDLNTSDQSYQRQFIQKIGLRQ